MKDLSSSKTILVPTDFTKVAQTALDHANHIATLLNKTVTLLHVVKEDKEKKKADEQIKAIASDNKLKSGIETSTVVDVGSIFTEIGKVADIVGAALVVMGTHGVKGIQKLVGSYALRVITNSNVPFVVVQEKAFADHGYKNIVLPMYFAKESKQKLEWAVYVAKLFNSKCHIIADYESDEFSAKAVTNNVAYSRSFLKNNGVDFEVTELDKNSASLEKETIRYSVKVNADLIVVMTTLDKSLSEFIIGTPEQYIIANEAQIPVMCINPIDIMRSKEGLTIAFGG